MPATYAVLTGDLIASSDLSSADLDRAFRALRTAGDEIATWQDADVRLTRFRGDGWQICLSRPELALRAALLMRAALRAEGRRFATRIATATGPGNPGDSDKLSGATGPVFVASGRALDALAERTTMRHASGGAIGAAVRLADHISRDWTQVQAEAMVIFLRAAPPTRAEAGKMLRKSRQAVDQALSAAGFNAIDDALRMIEEPGK